ncbi:phospholipase D-like domain-containing protein [Streptomyces spiramenti]|uniref:Cardiolipin synthase B n=1 Tax=Streptomyces spiramenti TaxID=2720606 RepID=A0ABX1AM17_9ACTN|nr:cardiolipin synthase B [Streptomyces spiramenti]
MTAPAVPASPTPAPAPAGSPDHAAQRLRRRLERLIGVAATEGNALRVLRNGDEIFPAMLATVRGARHTIDLMTFVYWQGDIAREFAEALAERARAGVRVRLLLDGFGSRNIERELLDAMEEAGVCVTWFRRPVRLSPFKQNHRCHRKVLVVDEIVAYTGGVGIAEEWCGDARDATEWRDTHVEVRGPAVDGICAAFAQNWAECHPDLFDERDRFVEQEAPGGAVVQVVRGSASIGWQDMQTLLRVVIESAESRLRLATAYFSPDDYFVDLLCGAAARGVEVELLVPGPHTDKQISRHAGRYHYDRMLACGVRILEYQRTMLHCKIVTVDGVASLVGSTNLNRRSLDHDEEVMMAVLDRDVTAALDSDFERDRGHSLLVDRDRWQSRPLSRRAAERATRTVQYFL